MPQFPLCAEFVPLLVSVKSQLAELKNLSQEFLSSGNDETKREAFLKVEELEKTKQHLIELKEQPSEFRLNQVPRIEKELLVFFVNKLGDDLEIEVNSGVVYEMSVEGSKKSVAVLEGCLKYLKLFVGLRNFFCNDAQITSLPELPANLRYLYCSNTQLASLPELPSSLQNFYCSNTQVTLLPELPASLELLSCCNTPAAKNPETKKQLEEFKKNHPDFNYEI